VTFVISTLAFIVLLSFLVLIHECGHFFAARRAKVVVEEFGFGLPPRAKTLFHQGGTRFSLNWIPFGGFVRLKGENVVHESERTQPGNFAAAGIPARIGILVAGVAMNFLFAIVIFTLGFSFWHWVPTYISFEDMKAAATRGEITLDPGVRIAGVQQGGTAATAHVPAGSLLLSVDNQPVYAPADVVKLQEGKTSVTYVLKPGDNAGPSTLTVPVAAGKTGVELQFSPQVTSPNRSVPQALLLSLQEAKSMTVQTVLGIGQLATSLVERGKVPEGITGIVGIAVLTHDTIREGFMHYLRLVAVLSLSLAILNILPFPALDGGRLAFVLYELVRGRPAPRQFELVTNTVGFGVLLTLIVIITYNDIVHLF
jgi:regulator of sigma E protease